MGFHVFEGDQQSYENQKTLLGSKLVKFKNITESCVQFDARRVILQQHGDHIEQLSELVLGIQNSIF